jgi:hypothetical protein
VTLLWRYNLRALRSVVNSYHNPCAVGAAEGVNLGTFTAQWLSLHKPHKVDGDKKQNNERRASNKVRLYGSKRPFIHSWFPFV